MHYCGKNGGPIMVDWNSTALTGTSCHGDCQGCLKVVHFTYKQCYFAAKIVSISLYFPTIVVGFKLLWWLPIRHQGKLYENHFCQTAVTFTVHSQKDASSRLWQIYLLWPKMHFIFCKQWNITQKTPEIEGLI